MNKHTAKDPAGVVHTRNSKDRLYSHTVFARRKYEHEMDDAQRFDPGMSNFHHYRAYINGTSRFLQRESWETEEQHAERVARDVARATEALAGCATYEEWRSLARREAMARVDARKAKGEFEKWINCGWCGRLDLAQKLATSLASKGYYSDVCIQKAEVRS